MPREGGVGSQPKVLSRKKHSAVCIQKDRFELLDGDSERVTSGKRETLFSGLKFGTGGGKGAFSQILGQGALRAL